MVRQMDEAYRPNCVNIGMFWRGREVTRGRLESRLWVARRAIGGAWRRPTEDPI